MADIYQVFVRLLDGKHTILKFSTPSVSAQSIKNAVHEITTIPIQHQRLVSNGRQLEDQALVSTDGNFLFPTVHLLLRLRGGKGGFGSLLRGAATKAGQKKTNNFDACRDMSGRRLRHVNAEKKMEEWRAEAEERRLEKIAEEFIQKKVKAVKKAGGSGDAEKYVQKYREDSAKCMEEVERTVRESLAGSVNSKRKTAGSNGSEAKRLKIWMGKRKLGDSDSDSDDTDEDNCDDDDEKEKSVVLDTGINSDSSKDAEGSSGSVTNVKLEEENSVGCSTGSGSEEEEKEAGLTGNLESHGGTDSGERNLCGEPNLEIHDETTGHAKGNSLLEEAVLSKSEPVQSEKEELNETTFGGMEATVSQPCNSSLGKGGESGKEATAEVIKDHIQVESVAFEETLDTNINDDSKIEKPLNFDDFSTAAELEVLGMERLKTELLARGLKCGGTLQERAARLFLLKTMTVDKLPKKLLAKK